MPSSRGRIPAARVMFRDHRRASHNHTHSSLTPHAPNNRRVSLLKVDVEGAELMVMQGIKPEDWAKIDQVALEVSRAAGAWVINGWSGGLQRC